uniref:Aldolase_II domain-containing protein n=1 Tax=Haemonchus contortus TaxID=6289 RepID=A0A7I4YYZ9_HAECO|nr:Class II aldolase adducin domain containing protein [Haemonchus contortus]
MFPEGVQSCSSVPNIPVKISQTPISDLEPGKYSHEESRLRCQLASLYRLVDLFRWSQGIYNHITVRLPGGGNEFLINPFGLLYHEITAGSLVKVDLDGKILDPGTTDFGINKAGYVLHSAIHGGREDLLCVIHLHVPSVVAVSAMKCGLLKLCQEAMIVGEVAYHDYQGIVVDPNERESLVKDMGSHNVMLLRNHGFVAAGRTIEEAFHYAYHLILACETQVRAINPIMIGEISLPSDDSVQKAYKTASHGGGGVNLKDGAVDNKEWGIGELEWQAWMRTLDEMGLRTDYKHRKK